jgi:hypothetical protein
VAVTLTHKGGSSSPRIFVCASGTQGSSIASPGWNCEQGSFGGYEFDIERLSTLYLALFIASSTPITAEMKIGISEVEGLHRVVSVGIVVLVASILSVIVIVLVQVWRSRRGRYVGERIETVEMVGEP